MAARLTDKQKKRIKADYLELNSYNAVAKLHGVSRQTVKNIVTSDAEIGQKLQQKKNKIPPIFSLTWKASGILYARY